MITRNCRPATFDPAIAWTIGYEAGFEIGNSVITDTPADNGSADTYNQGRAVRAFKTRAAFVYKPLIFENNQNICKKTLDKRGFCAIIIKLEAEAARFSLAVFRHCAVDWQKIIGITGFFGRQSAGRFVFVFKLILIGGETP